jgi:hypothetical protein
LALEGNRLRWIYNTLPLDELDCAVYGRSSCRSVYARAVRALALFHLLGGVLLFGLAFQREFVPMTALMLAYAFFYAPTLALSNSVAFRNLKDPEIEFGPIRVWGTIGWIAANLLVTFVRSNFQSLQWGIIDVFALAGGISVLAAVLSLTLPHTPPARESVRPAGVHQSVRTAARPELSHLFHHRADCGN